jgi:hypothetical protein
VPHAVRILLGRHVDGGVDVEEAERLEVEAHLRGGGGAAAAPLASGWARHRCGCSKRSGGGGGVPGAPLWRRPLRGRHCPLPPPSTRPARTVSHGMTG